nr:MAG TPA: hypothetical protein [Bacteriophage sp.]
MTRLRRFVVFSSMFLVFRRINKNYPLPTLHSVSKVSWDSTQSVQRLDVYAQAYTDVYGRLLLRFRN